MAVEITVFVSPKIAVFESVRSGRHKIAVDTSTWTDLEKEVLLDQVDQSDDGEDLLYGPYSGRPTEEGLLDDVRRRVRERLAEDQAKQDAWNEHRRVVGEAIQQARSLGWAELVKLGNVDGLYVARLPKAHEALLKELGFAPIVSEKALVIPWSQIGRDDVREAFVELHAQAQAKIDRFVEELKEMPVHELILQVRGLELSLVEQRLLPAADS